jgi:hypothetical protein
VGSGSKSGAVAPMLRNGVKHNIVPLRETSVVMDGEVEAADEVLPHLDAPRRFPIVSSLPRMPLMIPDEILDYYGWVFCQGGFLNLQMTFEQFLTVVAAVSPTGLCPEYDEGIRVQTTD